jgi:hypothetical protein
MLVGTMALLLARFPSFFLFVLIIDLFVIYVYGGLMIGDLLTPQQHTLFTFLLARALVSILILPVLLALFSYLLYNALFSALFPAIPGVHFLYFDHTLPHSALPLLSLCSPSALPLLSLCSPSALPLLILCSPLCLYCISEFAMTRFST